MSNDFDNRLIFLLSMPRSGSTLFSLMLGSNPEVCCPPEPWIILLLAEYMNLGDVRNTPYGRNWAELAAMEFMLSSERKQKGAISEAFKNAGEIFGMESVPAARRLLEMAYKMQLDVSDKRVFVDKTPRYYAALDLIDQLFPKAKKIILLRNPLDVYASYKMSWNNIEGIFTPDGVTVGTRDFCEGLFNLADYSTSKQDGLTVIRYEDLVREPEKTLRQVCEFANIDFSPAMLKYYENTSLTEEYRRSPVGDLIQNRSPSISKRTSNAWETRLEKAEIQSLIDVLGAGIFERLGYLDTVTRLREISIDIPTEEQAVKMRSILMKALVVRVKEKPYSTWDSYLSPLRNSQIQLARMQSFSGFIGYKFNQLKRSLFPGSSKR